jgi:hypothetical protein
MNFNPRTAIIILHDILVAAFAWLAAYWLRFNLAVPPEFQAAALSTLAWVVPLQAAVFWRFGLYRGIWRFASLPDLKRIVLAVGIAALLIPLVPLSCQRSGAALGADSRPVAAGDRDGWQPSGLPCMEGAPACQHAASGQQAGSGGRRRLGGGFSAA